ncbi:hypothetical protein [Peribacillus glennii]|uniref:hypothetical protein n=1 Tax=Peribacillus glennii TaxID=2303991 RepID=UPI001F3B8C36|nr:hypothetical protein [Peribacillus glennii]
MLKYEEAGLPFIHKGWVRPVDRWHDFDPFILMAEDWFKEGLFRTANNCIEKPASNHLERPVFYL